MNTETLAQDVTIQEAAHHRELKDVFKERLRQLEKFGPQNRPPYQWFLILSEEVGEVAKECVEMEFDDAAHPHAYPERYYKELTEVAAVALAAMQNFNQRRPKPAPRPKKALPAVPSKEALAALFWEKLKGQLTRQDEPLEAEDIRDSMPFGEDENPHLHVQVHIRGFTDWYYLKFDANGQPDPATIEQLPF